MTIFESINQSQILLQRITNHKQLSVDTEITDLLTSLATELENINSIALQITQQLSPTDKQSSSNTKPNIKSGCYVFTNEKGFFCPDCYDKQATKVPTTRLNSKLRICPACRASIK